MPRLAHLSLVLDATYYDYYDGQRIVETRNGSHRPVRRNVWGRMYVDELVATAVNADPGDPLGSCDRWHYAMHDANFNVLGLADAWGVLVERYEYTPYGRRTSSAVSHLGSIDSPSLTSNVSPVMTTARHSGPPPERCNPTPLALPGRHVAPLITAGPVF